MVKILYVGNEFKSTLVGKTLLECIVEFQSNGENSSLAPFMGLKMEGLGKGEGEADFLHIGE